MGWPYIWGKDANTLEPAQPVTIVASVHYVDIYRFSELLVEISSGHFLVHLISSNLLNQREEFMLNIRVF